MVKTWPADQGKSCCCCCRIRPLPRPLACSVQFSSREEWWDGFHAVLIDAGLTREQVVSVARGANVALREGTTELMRLLQERGVSA